MYEDVITVFNRKLMETGPVWYPTVLERVQFSWDKASVPAGYGWRQDDRTVALVPYLSMEGAVTVGGKLWLPPKMWQRVEEPELYVTFTGGEDFDLFINGTWTEDEPIPDDRWTGGFYERLCQVRDGVWAIAGVHRYGALPHFEITGR